MSISRMPAFAAGAIFALVVGSGTALAATGGDFVLGKRNSAGTTTTLTSQRGPALSLHARRGAPALKVDSGRKVRNLNADRLDGLSAGSFARAGGKTGFFVSTAAADDADGNGVNDIYVALAVCPPGTQRTGGGVQNFSIGQVLVNSPDTGHSWVVGVIGDNVNEIDASNIEARVVCYNPRGSVRGGQSRTTASDVRDVMTPAFMKQVRQRLAAAQ